MSLSDEILDHAPDKADVLKMMQRICKAIGTADPRTVFVACAKIMELQADLLCIGKEKV